MIFPPGTKEPPPYPPESLTVDQVRYALSQWFPSLRHGRRARRILLSDVAAWIAYHLRHNTEAKISHTRTMRKTLSKSGIDVDQIRTCLESNFALYCYESFDPAEARRLIERLEVVYTPKHGSWLNIA